MLRFKLFNGSTGWVPGVLCAVIGVACGAGSPDGMFEPGGGGGGGAGADGGGAGEDGGPGIDPDVIGGGESSIVSGVPQISGRVMAPNGAFPISGALVYLSASFPEEIPTGTYHYECDDMTGTHYAISEPDGTWTIKDAPVGNWHLVTRKGNFRRIRDLKIEKDMDTAVAWDLTTLPRGRTSDGLDVVPSFAVVKTTPDVTYNLLARFGMGDVNGAGALILGSETFDIYEESKMSSYPYTGVLFDQDRLSNYHMIFLPCNSSAVGIPFVNNNVPKLQEYVSKGGRIYNSCTSSLWTKAPFPEYINYTGSNAPTKFDIGRVSPNAYATNGQVLDDGLAKWLPIVSSADPSYVQFSNGFVKIENTVDVPDGHGLKADDYIVKPYTWVRDVKTYPDKPLMVTYPYDLGKVFYSVYETSSGSATITPQEFVLLYVILEVGVCENLPEKIQ